MAQQVNLKSYNWTSEVLGPVCIPMTNRFTRDSTEPKTKNQTQQL